MDARERALGSSGLRLLEWRVWREPEEFSRHHRASWYQSTLFGVDGGALRNIGVQ
jgi:hypothetical protein